MLETYLNDHLAGAMGGCDLAAHLEDRFRDSARAPAFVSLRSAVEEDRESLLQIMAELGVAERKIKQAMGWIGEKVTRIKLSGLTTGGQALGTLLSMEALGSGIQAKAALWENLRALTPTSLRLTEELDRLAGRAQDQLARLADERRAYAPKVLVPEGAS
jgi:hypothetical protein